MKFIYLFLLFLLSDILSASNIDTIRISNDGKYVLIESDSINNTIDIDYYELYNTEISGYFSLIAIKNNMVHIFDQTRFNSFRYPEEKDSLYKSSWIGIGEFYKMYSLYDTMTIAKNCDCLQDSLKSYYASAKNILGDSSPFLKYTNDSLYLFKDIHFQIKCDDLIIYNDTITVSILSKNCSQPRKFKVYRSLNDKLYFIYGELSWFLDFGEDFSTSTSEKIRFLYKNYH